MYTKFQIALQYFPHLIDRPDSASRSLRRWMHNARGLIPALQATGYRESQQYFSDRQVQILHEYLGEP